MGGEDDLKGLSEAQLGQAYAQLAHASDAADCEFDIQFA
jgi:hypothetical protein